MRYRTIPGSLSLLVILSLTGSQAYPSSWKDLTPLPEVLTLTPARDNLPDRIAKLAGAWQGRWLFPYGNGLPTTIVVESIDHNNVSAVYSWGEYVWNKSEKMEPGWLRVKGHVAGDSIVLRWGTSPKEMKVVLRLIDDATARAEYSFETFKSEAQLVRKALDNNH